MRIIGLDFWPIDMEQCAHAWGSLSVMLSLASFLLTHCEMMQDLLNQFKKWHFSLPFSLSRLDIGIWACITT